MSMTRDERHQLMVQLANHIHDGMSCNDVHEFVVEHLYAAYQEYSEEDLLDEIEEYAPHLLDKEYPVTEENDDGESSD